ncbi:MAG: threonylcarbamoyl-AMP synthase [Acidobacteria bacterium]|nr:threonylcarbamoyl-AMP synthase [Acidobacteriota bacterium]
MITLPFETLDDAVRASLDVRRIRGAGGVIVLPTETFYGLGADPASPEAVARIARMKARPAGMGILVLCAGIEQVERLAEVPDRWRLTLEKTWPAPVTVILPARTALPAATGGTVAVRVPAHGPLRALLEVAGSLTGTSANRHGRPAPLMAVEAAATLVEPPDLVLDGGRTPGGSPSTIIDLSGDVPRLVRRGAWRPTDLWKTLWKTL